MSAPPQREAGVGAHAPNEEARGTHAPVGTGRQTPRSEQVRLTPGDLPGAMSSGNGGGSGVKRPRTGGGAGSKSSPRAPAPRRLVNVDEQYANNPNELVQGSRGAGAAVSSGGAPVVDLVDGEGQKLKGIEYNFNI